jgi:acetyl-CoA carboxylase biotin carboxyl carrier protein
MTIDEIKQLIQVVLETGIAELEVRQGENVVHIRGAGSRSPEVVIPTVMPLATTAAPAANVTAAPSPVATPPEPAPQPAPDNNVIVKAPIVGTYYDAPSPGAQAFVKVGDRVAPKQVLCIIESMKLMNEIEAEMAGTIVAKYVENGRPVEYGESLFAIRPE